MSTSSTSLYGSTLSSILGNVNDAFSGKTSGIDVGTIVSELMQVERQPEAVWQQQQSTIGSQVSALTTMNTQLSTLYATDVNNLKDILGAFSQMSTASSDDALVSASADNTAVAGTHTIVVSNLATTSSSYSDYIPSGTSLAGAEIDIKYGSDPNNPVKTDTINIPSSDTTLQQAASYDQFRQLWGDGQRGNRFAGFAAGAGQQDFRGQRQSDGQQFRPPISPARRESMRN